MATMYRSTDPGTPAWPANGSFAGAKFLMDVLKACLVTGYGSKSPAGWSLVYEDTTANKHRLALSNGNGVVEFVTWAQGAVGVYIWDSITAPGFGAIGDSPYSDVVSDGINGWGGALSPVTGATTDMVVQLYTLPNTASNNTNNNVGWTVFADDKSCWLLFHYLPGSTSAKPGDIIQLAASHSQVFFGALKSVDLGRGEPGNFFLMYGVARSAAGGASSSTQTITNACGLRTPVGTVPTSHQMTINSITQVSGGNSHSNIYSSVRFVAPVLIGCAGPGIPFSDGSTGAAQIYNFATVPGLGQFDFAPQSNQTFWVKYSAEFMSSWNMETQIFNGIDWMPWWLNISTTNNMGITTDAGWWS